MPGRGVHGQSLSDRFLLNTVNFSHHCSKARLRISCPG
jgi:hypothetical protein